MWLCLTNVEQYQVAADTQTRATDLKACRLLSSTPTTNKILIQAGFSEGRSRPYPGPSAFNAWWTTQQVYDWVIDLTTSVRRRVMNVQVIVIASSSLVVLCVLFTVLVRYSSLHYKHTLSGQYRIPTLVLLCSQNELSYYNAAVRYGSYICRLQSHKPPPSPPRRHRFFSASSRRRKNSAKPS